MSPRCAQKLARLKTIVAERAAWASQLAQVTRMHGWVLDVEHILDGSWAQPGEVVRNATLGSRLDAWREQMAQHLSDGTLSELERECLTEFLQVLSNLRPYLVQCYDQKDFPRTNNEMERSIRGLKTQYRRISGAPRTGTPICCATGAVWPMWPGGSKMQPIESFWNSALGGLTVPAGVNYDGRPPSLRASNSPAFASATSAKPISTR